MTIFIRDTDDVHVFAIPTLDGGSVKVAPHASYGQLDDADDADHDHSVATADLEPINAAIAELLPGLVPTAVRVAAYMDAYAPDGHALVGQMPATSKVWLLGARSPGTVLPHGVHAGEQLLECVAGTVVTVFWLMNSRLPTPGCSGLTTCVHRACRFTSIGALPSRESPSGQGSDPRRPRQFRRRYIPSTDVTVRAQHRPRQHAGRSWSTSQGFSSIRAVHGRVR